MKAIAALVFVVLVSPLWAVETAKFQDDFSNPKLVERQAMRGDWIFKDGVASCVQDDELFKKYKDHGPIIFYDVPTQNAVVTFQFKSDAAKTVVFTANNADGHVFRFVLSEAGLSIRAFPADAPAKSIALGVDKAIALRSGEWTPVLVKLQGSSATVKVGSAAEKTYEHASLARPRTNLSLGFSYGALSVKDFKVEPQ